MTVSHPLPADLVDLIAERFRALSEPTRIKLLDRLREGEASVLDLTEAIGTTEQNVSKHLGVLHRAGIVARRKQGNFAYYSIADERVVRKHRAVVEQQLVALDPDFLDLVLVEDDAVAQLSAARPRDLLDLRQPEGDEQQARLVDVPVVAVDDVDLGLVGVEAAPQPVGGHRPAGAAAENHDPFPRHLRSPPWDAPRAWP